MGDCKRDEIARLVKLWSQAEGRDKFSKCLQYGSRGIAWLFQGNKELCSRFSVLYKTTSDSRKIFRLGKFLNEYIKLKSLLRSNNPHALLTLFQFASRSAFLLYWVFDGLTILSKIKFIHVDTATVTKRSGLFWFIGLTLGLLYEIYKIKKNMESERRLRCQLSLCEEDNSSGIKKSEIEGHLVALQVERNTCYINTTKNCGDMITASQMIGLTRKLFNFDFNDGLIALGGFTSALLSCVQLYD